MLLMHSTNTMSDGQTIFHGKSKCKNIMYNNINIYHFKLDQKFKNQTSHELLSTTLIKQYAFTY